MKESGNYEKFFGAKSLEAKGLLSESKNKYLEFLKKELETGNPDYLRIFDYGLNALKETKKHVSDEGLHDSDLKNYFFTISEIAGLKDEIRSFSIDLMLYAEGNYPGYLKFEEIERNYNAQIKPLLN